MAQLTDALTGLLDAQAPQIGRRIGADPQQTQTAINAAIPALLAALGQNAQTGGATNLKSALERDHDGSILDDLGAYLNGTANLSPRTTNGAGILEHTLGDRQASMQRALSAKSGLDIGSVGNLLALLAPIVLGMLSKRGQGSSSGGGIGLDDLTDILGREKTDAQNNPDLGDLLGGILGGGLGGALGGALGGDAAASGGTASAPARRGGGLADILGSLFGRKSR
jgi:hypothetical protein